MKEINIMKRVFIRHRYLNIETFAGIGVGDFILIYTNEPMNLPEFDYKFLDKPNIFEEGISVDQSDLDYIENNPGGKLYILSMSASLDELDKFKRIYEEG